MTCKYVTNMEQCGALRDVYETSNLYGESVKIYIREEVDVRRDSYEDIKAGKVVPAVPPITMPAFPVQFQPSRRQLEKAGCKEDCEVLIYTPMYSWNQLNLDFEDIDLIRSTVTLRDRKYIIKEKALSSQFTDTFLYITLALKRK